MSNLPKFKMRMILQRKETNEYILIIEEASRFPYFIEGDLYYLMDLSLEPDRVLEALIANLDLTNVLFVRDRPLYKLVLPTLEEIKTMNIEDLNEDQINQMHLAVQSTLELAESGEEVTDLDLQLAMWDVMESFGIPHQHIGALVKIHGEQIIGETLAKQLIGAL